MRKLIPVLMATLLPLTALPVSAQEDSTTIGTVVAPPGNLTAMDFAATVQMSDLFEIMAGRIAAQQASSRDVSAFGQRMVDDHTESSAQLKNELNTVIVGQRVSPPPQLDLEHLALYHGLQGAHGAEFDQLYLAQQIDAHRKSLAVMTSYARNGTVPALRRFASQTVPMIRDHLAMLRGMRRS